MLSAFSETVQEIREAGCVLLSSLCLVSVLEGADMALLPVGGLGFWTRFHRFLTDFEGFETIFKPF